MNYHGIVKDDMLNGGGIRVTIFLSGCTHHCDGCHNKQTWDPNSGVVFTNENMDTILEYAKDPAIAGITLSGGDPLEMFNILSNTERYWMHKDADMNDNADWDVFRLCEKFKSIYPDKSIWCYTGYTYEELVDIIRRPSGHPSVIKSNIESLYSRKLHTLLTQYIDVLVDGKFEKDKLSQQYPYAGSTNQRVIDISETIKRGSIVLYNN